MEKLKTNLIRKCRKLRGQGYSLGEISSATGVHKTTAYGYVNDIILNKAQQEGIKFRIRERNKNRINPRKGKCLPGREIRKPKSWSDNLVHVVAHFMFDGRVDNDGCIYYSNSKYQINHMRSLMYKLFGVKPEIKPRDNGVYGLTFYHVEFADYIRNRKNELIGYLSNGALASSKRIFLKAFFDDEGNVYYNGDKRRVRGYQKSRFILERVRGLLNNFGIEGKINKRSTDIEISGQSNLIKFSKEINFSPRIYINPQRKNGIWKKTISKRNILNLLLKSYQAI